MSETLRAFVAIELPQHARGALAALVRELGRASVRGLVPVRPHGIHLTLKFLGDVPRAEIEPMVAQVSRVVRGSRAFTLSLDGVGVFPGGAEPRVLWVGVDGDLPSLLEVQRGIEEVLAGLGHAREGREFSPHLTVARLRRGTPSVDRRRARDALLSAPWVSGLRIDVASISLMRSELSPEGARYHRLAHMPLAGNPASDAVD